MGEAVAAALGAALGGADAETRQYACDVACGVLDDASPGASPRELAEELEEALGPLLEDAGLGGDAVAALCASLAAARVGGGAAAPDAADAAERLVDLKSIILAFAGKARGARSGAAAQRCRQALGRR
jgi:hypothetical protein